MIVSLVGQKGGSGKTTVATCLAAEWHRAGHRVLLVDCDPQGTVRTWGEVAREAGLSAPTVIAMGADLWRQEQLPRLAQSYDRVVIDSPPRLGNVQRAALLAADVAVIPCGPGASDMWALAETLEVVNEARGLRPDLAAVVLLTQLDARTALGRTARESLADCGLPLLDATLGDRVAFPEALAAGLGVTTYQPQGQAAREVEVLVTELESLVVQEVAHVVH
jgi:chromosome partitioning protein